MSVNKVILVGRLGADPELRYTQSGDAIATLNVATSRRWKDKQGQRQEETEWHRVTFFGALGKVCGEYLKKGSQVYIDGRIKTDKYQKDGQDVYRTGIVGENMTMLDSKQAGTEQKQENNAQTRQKEPAGYDDYNDDIPF
jgi:single-strand DNA-binding protein